MQRDAYQLTLDLDLDDATLMLLLADVVAGLILFVMLMTLSSMLAMVVRRPLAARSAHRPPGGGVWALCCFCSHDTLESICKP